MNKFQKIAFTFFVIIAFLGAYLGYRMLKNIKQPTVKVLNMLPENCQLLLTFENFSEFTNDLRHKNLVWQDIQMMSALQPVEEHLHYFDSLLSSNEILHVLGSNNPVHLAIYPNKKFIIACNLLELSTQNTTQEELEKLKNSLAVRALVAEVKDGALCITNSDELKVTYFERKKESILNNKNFSQLETACNYNKTRIYIGNQSNAWLLQNTFSDVSLRPDKIILNGIKLKDSTLFLGDEKAAPITELEILERIPLVCNMFEVYAIGDAEKLFAENASNDWWQSVNERAMFNAKKQFYSLIEGSVIKVRMPSNTDALVIGINDISKIRELLPFMKDSSFYFSSVIHKLSNNGSFTQSTFRKLADGDVNFMVLKKDHIVLTSGLNDAEIFENAYQNGTSILDNKRFRSYASKNFDLEFHYLNYKLINSLNKKDIPFSDWMNTEDLASSKNIGNCSFLSSFKSGQITFRFNLGYMQDNFSDEPNVLWTIQADTIISSPPYVFKNHLNGGNEIVFQDMSNDLCLQTATGKQIWKKRIQEQVRSEIFVVDAFKNGKFQMLFNTDNFIHLIDRNGNEVQGYPVKLPAKATNKLSLFDYDNKNDPRLFIACSDHKIYNYSIWGIRQEGFRPFVVTNDVQLPVKYCRVGASDYLITADVLGKIYVFSRKGDGRIDFKNQLIERVDNFEVIPGNSIANTYLVYFDDKNGLIERISLSDKKEVTKLDLEENNVAHCFADFDKNKITDVMVVHENKVEILDLNGNRLYLKELAEEQKKTAVNYFSFDASNYINIFNEAASMLYIQSVEQNTLKEYKAGDLPRMYNLFNDGKVYSLITNGRELRCVKM